MKFPRVEWGINPPRIYIAGPMTHIPHFNFPEFDRVAEELRFLGYEVVSPAELDDPEDRARAMASPDGNPIQYTYGKTHADFLARDLKIIADRIDAIVVLMGWGASKGARVETFIGHVYGKPIGFYAGLGLIEDVPGTELAQAWAGPDMWEEVGQWFDLLHREAGH